MAQLNASADGADAATAQAPFTIAIIGAGPVGKLLAAFAKPHPRIVYTQYEAETPPLRPSFGYGVGPQTLRAAAAIDPALGARLRDKCLLGPVWMHLYHGGADNDGVVASVEVPPADGGVYGRLGRQELMELLDGFVPAQIRVQYGRRVVGVAPGAVVPPSPAGGENGDWRADNNDDDDDDDEEDYRLRMVDLAFEDGTHASAHAVWGVDGIQSVCRRFIQQQRNDGDSSSSRNEASTTPAYAGMLAFRGRVRAERVADEVGRGFDKETFMCLGVRGWCIWVFPIGSGEYIHIAAFCEAPGHAPKGRDHVVGLDELLSYFPGRSDRMDRLLRLLGLETAGGPQRLELTAIGRLPSFSSSGAPSSPLLTTFGDAANGMLPFIAGSLSTGLIGAATFLDEYNQRIGALPPDASDDEIAATLKDAAAVYDWHHRPLAQILHDYSAEQGPLWCSGRVDVDELARRPRFLWTAANHL